ncbi:MAG: LPS-assembly protein LptD [Pseudomonadota bacterium]
MPRRRLARTALCLMLGAGACLGSTARAEEATPCPERPPRPGAALRPAAVPAGNPPAQLSAREVRLTPDGVSEFSGDVELQRDGQSLGADYLRHDRRSGMLDATGHVTLREPSGLSYISEETHINLESRLGYAGRGSFRFEDGSARGDAERIDFEGPDRTHLTRVRYTTCAPGQDDWFLRMRELELDTAGDIGTARHASVSLLGVPVFYLPYLSFPISDQRKSGFLLPRLGRSDKRGTEIAAPYYLNLAPDFDDTLTPRYLSRRGWQLQNEFRYLTRRSEGKLDLEALPNDRAQNRDDRAAGAYAHRQVFSPRWSGNVDVRAVSDKQYFEDFGDNLGLTSQTHLPQNARVDYRGPRWNFSTLAADYQTVDPTIAPADRPYARLPQVNLALNRPQQPNRVNYYFESEAVNFDRNVGVTGGRLNLAPAVALPLSNSYGFITPRVGVRHISYSLASAPDESPSVTRGVFSLDSGLTFERESMWSERRFTQTLEPRLYYLFIPASNQDSLPNFDTALPEFSFANLFRDNRFSGGDRIGDANQLTAALTTRFIDDKDGSERGRASLGRIYYFDDREVNLPAGTVATAASDIVGEATATLASHWHARSSVQWNRADSRTEKYSVYLQYNPARNRIINLGKRYSRDELEQTDVSTEWPLAARWTLRARSLYSQRDHRNVESYAGAEYNACCWALRVVAGRRLVYNSVDNTAEQSNTVMFELELTGLSRLGSVPDSPLRESMFSFRE